VKVLQASAYRSLSAEVQPCELAAAEAVAHERAADGMPLSLTLTGSYGRGQVMSAQVVARVPIGSLPLLGHFGTVVVHGRASAPIDRYRSLLEGGPP
jgi:hypothetical protein